MKVSDFLKADLFIMALFLTVLFAGLRVRTSERKLKPGLKRMTTANI